MASLFQDGRRLELVPLGRYFITRVGLWELSLATGGQTFLLAGLIEGKSETLTFKRVRHKCVTQQCLADCGNQVDGKAALITSPEAPVRFCLAG